MGEIIGLMAKIVELVSTFEKKDADTLYFSLVEMPNPRNTAVFSIDYGSVQIASSHLSMDEAGIEKACRIVEYHSERIKRCSYKKVEFQNLSEWAKAKIEATLSGQSRSTS